MSMDFMDDELTQSFILESLGMLDEVEPRIIDMQKAVERGELMDEEDIHAVFRHFHSINGSSSFLRFNFVSSLAHESESILDIFRKDHTGATTDQTNLLLKACDLIRTLLNLIYQQGNDQGHDQEVDTLMHALHDSRNVDLPTGGKPGTEGIHHSSMEISTDAIVSPEMVQMFIAESKHQIDIAEQALNQIIQQPGSIEKSIAEAFRAIHTIKGNCALLSFSDLEQLTHKTETILDKMREGQILPDAEVVSKLLQTFHHVRNQITLIASSIEVPDDQDKPVSESGTHHLTGRKTNHENQSVDAVSTPREPHGEEVAFRKRPASSSTMRKDIPVSIEKLDRLGDIVGELIKAESRMIDQKHPHASQTLPGTETVDRLKHISQDLQDVVMSLRKIPMEPTFKRMTRLVQNLADKSLKKVSLSTSGEDTEFDRSVVEILMNPIMHIIRNAVDHGMEFPEERAAADKPETGEIKLQAGSASNEGWIIISDDGRGLDKEKILAIAEKRGLIPDRTTSRDDQEVFQLILEPGFSTMGMITDLSGRGVGMDIVKQNLERLGGQIDIQSQSGKGTSFTMRIPTTLTILRGLQIRVGNDQFAIPLTFVHETFAISQDLIAITDDNEYLIYYRGTNIPLHSLRSILTIPGNDPEPGTGYVVIIGNRFDRVALWVDEIVEQQHIIMKNQSSPEPGEDDASDSWTLSNGTTETVLNIAKIIHKLLGVESNRPES